MTQDIESVDNLPQPTMNNRVQQADRSKEEKDQKTFNDELKKKMKKKKKPDTEDTLMIDKAKILELNENKQEENDDKSEDRQLEPADEKSEEEEDKDADQQSHIDLKI